jgi:hypothetical protein
LGSFSTFFRSEAATQREPDKRSAAHLNEPFGLRSYRNLCPSLEPLSPRPLLTSAIAATATLDPESLRRRLAPLTSDTGHAAECVTVLLKIVPKEELTKALGVVTLQDFAASVEAWACATDHPDDRAAAASLTAALDALQQQRTP